MFCKTSEPKAKLSIFALGIAFGITEGLFLLVLAWSGWLGGYGMPLIGHISTFMSGFSPSMMGGLIGAFWGFVDGFIFGLIAAIIYNVCLCCCCKKSSSLDAE